MVGTELVERHKDLLLKLNEMLKEYNNTVGGIIPRVLSEYHILKNQEMIKRENVYVQVGYTYLDDVIELYWNLSTSDKEEDEQARLSQLEFIENTETTLEDYLAFFDKYPNVDPCKPFKLVIKFITDSLYGLQFLTVNIQNV